MKNFTQKVLVSFLFLLVFSISTTSTFAHENRKYNYYHYNKYYGSYSREDMRKIEEAREYFRNHADFYKNSKAFPAIYLHGKMIPL
ncbi:MAG: hypothetical protein Q7R95_08750 [bacterium]|nr:hypothetical protein [bacterium]